MQTVASSSEDGLNKTNTTQREVSTSDTSQEPVSRRPRSSSFRENRQAFLEQTRQRSWASLSGYDTGSMTKNCRRPKYDEFSVQSSPSLVRMQSNGSPDRSNSNDSSNRIERLLGGSTSASIQDQGDPYVRHHRYARRNKRNSAGIDEMRAMSREFKMPLSTSSAGNQSDMLADPMGLVMPPASVGSKSLLVAPRTRKSKVQFSTVEVRQYERILGDNPGVSSGPPISIGWNFYEDRTVCISVDEYEYEHAHGTHHDETDMVLSRDERESILRELGFDQKDVARSVRKNYKLKKKRRQTVNNLSAMAVEEVIETARKSFSRMLPRGRKFRNKKMYKEWKRSCSESSNFDDESAASSTSGVRSILRKTSSYHTFDTGSRTQSTHDMNDQTVASKISDHSCDRLLIGSNQN